MSLKSWFGKLEARERRLLTILGAVIGVGVFLAGPIALVTMVTSRKSDNEEIRDTIDKIYESRAQVGEKRAKHDALVGRYAKKAPPLAGFLDEIAKAQGITAAESQDRQAIPHGKKYFERVTVIKMHKVGMLALAKMLEKIEQSGYPVAVTKLSLKPRSGEPDSYEIELGVSAFDRTPDAKAPGAAASGSASASGSAAPSGAPSGASEQEDAPEQGDDGK